MTDNSDAVLKVEHLTKTFVTNGAFHSQKVHAVNDVSFGIASGRTTVIVGESGSGKSTIARLIVGLLRSTSGTLEFLGRKYDPWQRKQLLHLRSEIQMIFQDPFGSLNPVYTIGYHLTRPLRNYGKCGTRREAREKALEVLESVGLSPASDYFDKYPHQLSGGQRQRVVIARALVVEPKLILADEPTSMLDVSIRMGVLNLMKSLQKQRNLSMLFITHDLASARYVGDDLLVMYAGNLVEGGTVDDVVSSPAHPYTRLLLSAVPDVRQNPLDDEVESIGDPPNLANLPSGCHFHPRCPFAMELCKKAKPERADLGNAHWTTCHLYSGIGSTLLETQTDKISLVTSDHA